MNLRVEKIFKFQKEPKMNPKSQKENQITNGPKIAKKTQISKETQITNEPPFFKEHQISNQTQITNESQIIKEHQIF